MFNDVTRIKPLQVFLSFIRWSAGGQRLLSLTSSYPVLQQGEPGPAQPVPGRALSDREQRLGHYEVHSVYLAKNQVLGNSYY